MEKKNDLQLIKEGLKVAVLDIESTGLQADYGYVLAACLKEVNSDNLQGTIHTLRIDDKDNPNKSSDEWILKNLITRMDSYDLIITWYGSGFDIPFINSRALRWGLRPPVRNFRRDLYYVARANGRLRSNKLVVWDQFLNGKALKTPITSDIWNLAIRGDKKALDYIVKHCELDVLSTEKMYKKFMPLLGKLRKN